jgi:hypothetical protein
MQRYVAWLSVVVLSGALAHGDSPATRHGVTADLKSFPQSTPKETLASVLKAIELKRFDYLLAHLADPEWVDNRAEAESFKELVQETRAKLDAPTVKKLMRFLEEGEFETLDTQAVIRHKVIKDRVVRLRKIDKRWYFQQANKP